MKVYGINNNVQNDKRSLQNSQSFSGASVGLNSPITSALTGFFSAVERGGFAGSFMVNDVATTCIPRTYQAGERGKEETGETNWLAAAEVALREFITGPSMFAVPFLAIYFAAKLSGSANNVPTGVIKDFSQILKNVSVEKLEAPALKREFYTQVFKDIAKNTFEKDKDIDVSEHVKKLIEAQDAPERTSWEKFRDKPHKSGVKAKDQIVNEIAEMFARDKKARVPYKEDFTTGKLASGKPIQMNKIISYMQDYADEVIDHIVKKHKESGFVWENVIEKFKNKRIGTRFITNISAYAATFAFLTIIPKIYSFNKENPETKALYARVEKDRRGATNENKR